MALRRFGRANDVLARDPNSSGDMRAFYIEEDLGENRDGLTPARLYFNQRELRTFTASGGTIKHTKLRRTTDGPEEYYFRVEDSFGNKMDLLPKDYAALCRNVEARALQRVIRRSQVR
jgi:hypothetical protein